MHVARERIGGALARTIRSPASWLFAAIWIASALTLVATGHGFPMGSLTIGAGYLLLSLLTVALTRDPPVTFAPPTERPRLRLQLGLVLVVVVLTAWRGLAFHGVVAPGAATPLWTPLVESLERLGGAWFGNANFLANPATYVAIPLAALLLAGARLSGLGFARGHRIGRALLLWGALPVAFFAYALLAGQLAVERLFTRFLSNALQNGPMEEFLFRGALQTRLGRLWGAEWALVAQALLFGAWHLGLGYTTTAHAGFLPALASVLVHQAVIGLAFGVIFARTRNLVAPSVVHVLGNSLG